jgi:hypothetical protein
MIVTAIQENCVNGGTKIGFFFTAFGDASKYTIIIIIHRVK